MGLQTEEPIDAAMRDSPVSDVAIQDAPFASPETDIEDLREVFQEQQLPVPIVDEDGTLVGLVRPGDVEDRVPGDEPNGIERGRTPMMADDAAPSPRRAADVMMPLVFYLPSDATIAHAVALLVEEGATYAPLVSTRGRYAGMIDGLSLLRWIAQSSGYIVPERRSVLSGTRLRPHPGARDRSDDGLE